MKKNDDYLFDFGLYYIIYLENIVIYYFILSCMFYQFTMFIIGLSYIWHEFHMCSLVLCDIANLVIDLTQVNDPYLFTHNLTYFKILFCTGCGRDTSHIMVRH